MSMTKQEEERVIDAVLAGDTGRFESLVLAHQTGVYRLCLRMLGNEQDALDAAQESFFRAYRSLASFRRESRFSAWLYKLAGNICLDMLRKRPAVPDLPLSDADGAELSIPDTRPSPQAALEKKELRQAVHRGLLQLAPAFREILVLRDVNGLSYEEIAHATGLGPGTVKSRIFRARKKLAAILLRDGNFSEPEPSISPEAGSFRKGGADA